MKAHLYYTSFLLSIFISVSERSNAQSWLWANSMEETERDFGRTIAVDPINGDVYTTGSFSGTVDFDPGMGVFNLTSPVFYNYYFCEYWDENCYCYLDCSFYDTTFTSSMFISKLNGAGNFVWAKTMGGLDENSHVGGYSIAVDSIGGESVYTTGSFSGTVDFDPGAGVFNLTSPAHYYYYYYECWDENCYCYIDCSYYDTTFISAMFISKFNNSGNFLWAKAIERTEENSHVDVYTIAIDQAGSGDVYTTGYFRGTVDFDPGTGTFNLSGEGIFISKLDSSGNFVWAKAIDGIDEDQGLYIAIDPIGDGDVYITSSFQGTIDFDPGGETFNLTSSGNGDIFICKLDDSGNFAWAKSIGGIGGSNISSSSLAVHTAGGGEVYTTGVFSGTVDFDPGSSTFNITGAGVFIFKLDGSGNFEWAKSIGGTNGSGHGKYIKLDPAGNGDFYTTGYFWETVDFDPGAGTFNLTSVGSADIFISKLDSQGNFVGATAIGGTGNDYGNYVALDANDNIFLSGHFESPSITFGSTTITFEDGSGIFLAKRDALESPCTSIVTSISDSGNGSLRDIISCSSSGATITFSLAPLSQITLTTGEILINKNLFIDGPGLLNLTISGNNASRIFHVLPGKNLDIENVSLKNTASSMNGGAIFVEGILNLENVLFQNNIQSGVPKAMTISPGGLVTINGNVDIKN